MQTRSSLHLYLIALIIAAIVIPFALSRPYRHRSILLP